MAVYGPGSTTLATGDGNSSTYLWHSRRKGPDYPGIAADLPGSTWGAATTPTATDSGSYRSAVSLNAVSRSPQDVLGAPAPVLLRDPTEEPVATLNRQICTQRIPHLAARLVIRTRRYTAEYDVRACLLSG